MAGTGIGAIAVTLLLSLVLAASLASPARAQSGVAVSLDPRLSSLQPGETTVVAVTISGGATGLYGIQFQLSFDPAVLEVVDADRISEGVQIGVGPLLAKDLIETAGPDYLVAQNSVDAGRGVIGFTIVQLNPAKPPEQGGVVATVEFLAKETGESSLELGDLLLSDAQGRDIAASASGGNIAVVPPPTSTPPPTPTPPATAAPLPTATLQPTPTAPLPTPTAAATETPAVVSTPQPPATPPPPTVEEGGLSAGAIVGIIVVVVALLAAAAGGVLFVRRRGAPPPGTGQV